MPKGIESLFRSRWFWILLLAMTYFLPALLVQIPMALAYPWVMIPGAHLGLQEGWGLHYLYGGPALAFAICFHIVFWTLCGLLLFRGKKLSTIWLRVFSILLIAI